MVSLDDAVIARFEKGGSRYEILVDPDLVAQWKENPENVDFEEMLATDEVWSDARAGDRPTAEALQNIFGTTDLVPCVERILRDGSIQLTTMQRKKMVENKRKQIINAIATTATDPKTRSPHPPIRIEHALDEARFSVDPRCSHSDPTSNPSAIHHSQIGLPSLGQGLRRSQSIAARFHPEGGMARGWLVGLHRRVSGRNEN